MGTLELRTVMCLIPFAERYYETLHSNKDILREEGEEVEPTPILWTRPDGKDQVVDAAN